MSQYLIRAQMLIQQSRFELADTEIRQALVQDPDNAQAHALLAICLVEMEQFKEASRESELAIELAPDSSFSFYVASLVSSGRNQFKKAESEIEQAIDLDFEMPEYFAQLAQIKIAQKKWQDALDAAEQGLEFDPEDVTCINLRAIALVKLGKRSEAGDAIGSALEKSPEDAYSHANMGWSLIEQGEPKEAMQHFKEALRLEPNMEWARVGIVESMKSQFFLYRWLLGWFMWASKMDGKSLMLILVGGYVGVQIMSSIALRNPALSPYLMPFIIAYIAFAILTWIAVPMFNLLLRCNKFGRLVLSDEEKTISTWVGACLLVAVGLIVTFFISGQEIFLGAAFAVGWITPILGSYYASDEGWPRTVHGLLLVALTLFAITLTGCSVASLFSSESSGQILLGITNLLLRPLLFLAIGSQFAVNFLVQAKPVRGSSSSRWLGIGGAAAMGVMAITCWAGIAVLAWLGGGEGMLSVQTPPLEVEISKSDSLNWRFGEELASLTEQLEDLGFQNAGDFYCAELDYKIRKFLHSNQKIVGDLVEYGHSKQLTRSMSAAFEDGGVLELTTMETELNLPPNWEIQTADVLPSQMFERLSSEIEGKAVRQLSKNELGALDEGFYSQATNFLFERGGRSVDELKRMAKRDGQTVSDAEIEKYRRLWSNSARQKVSEASIEKFLKTNPEFQNRKANLICLNRYSQAVDFLKLMKSDGIKTGDLGLLIKGNSEKIPEVLGNAIDPGKAQLVGSVDTPIKTQVYLKL